MEKRRLAALPRQAATDEMVEMADRLGSMRHMVTAELVEDGDVLMMHVYRISELREGKREAEFRTFFSKEDYITQRLGTSKVRWQTASFVMMDGFAFTESHWNQKKSRWESTEFVYIRSRQEKELLCSFFGEHAQKDDGGNPWPAVCRFQEEVKEERLAAKHKRETDRIDALMETVEEELPKDFRRWVWEEAMEFSRYLAYTPIGRKKASCECTCCGRKMIVDRKKVRLRNNEKGTCPNCGKKVTVKARGKMAGCIWDERWVTYAEPGEDGFVLRYFHAARCIRRTEPLTVTDELHESARSFYTFRNGKPETDCYEYAEYKQTGRIRWCHDQGRIHCGLCILYLGNLPQAWEHTPLRYSALEILAKNMTDKPVRYESGIRRFLEFPALEWLIKMGLCRIAGQVIDGGIYGGCGGRLNFHGKTIYDILKLGKEETRILQQIDGNMDELRLLQVAGKNGVRFSPESLREYYDTFGCNTDLLGKTKKKVSLHKLVKYITKESGDYPVADPCGCGMYRTYRYEENPEKEKMRNMARDWMEYLRWCRELKYDLDDLYIYLPNGFKKVHDRTAKEYRKMQDRKAAAERRRKERQAKKRMEQTRAALAEILRANEGNTDAFALCGKGLVLVVPETADDIRAEGTALHHCVGTYVDRVARGETNIFFIRKKEEPEKPYYTMEWKHDQVQQCRGAHNCAMTPEVKAFTEAFEQIMTGNIKKTERKAVPA